MLVITLQLAHPSLNGALGQLEYDPIFPPANDVVDLLNLNDVDNFKPGFCFFSVYFEFLLFFLPEIAVCYSKYTLPPRVAPPNFHIQNKWEKGKNTRFS